MVSAFLITLALGVSMFAANLLASRKSYANVYKPLAFCFAANSIFLCCLILRELSAQGYGFSYSPEIVLFKIVVELTVAPLFWIYVRELTSEHGYGFRRSDSLHFIFPLAPSAVLAIIIFVFFPDSASENVIGIQKFVNELNRILNIAALAQFCFYAYIVMRRLAAYRKKLMYLFSSTEGMELRWFRILLLLVLFGIGLEVISEIQYTTVGLPNPFSPWNDLLRLIFDWLLAVWGLRQLPDLRIETSETHANTPAVKKYEKSAIPLELLTNVSTKIRDFMENQNGYRDSSLSLKLLAEKISVRPDYISQTLNREIEESFFDYVNRLRAEEAMVMLVNTNSTVLSVSTDVGFNSRSSFYKAFKKETGCTPTEYRRKNKAS